MNRELIATLIVEEHSAGRCRGDIVGVMLVADIVGFTRMTRGFLDEGRQGAEGISKVIAASIAPAVNAVEACGGIVLAFAGDAFSAVFPEDDATNETDLASRVLKTLNLISSACARSRVAGPGGGTICPAIKIGLARGAVSWSIVSATGQSVVYFDGTALAMANGACEACGPNQIAFDRFALSVSPHPAFDGAVADGGARLPCLYELDHFHNEDADDIRPPERGHNAIARELSRSFHPVEILELETDGELRDIVVCMLALSSAFDRDSSLTSLVEAAHESGAHFNKIDISDKGMLALVIYGAPIARDRMPQRAAVFLASILQRHGETVRAGLTMGTAFTGFVGSERRCEYTALGDVVNLAARFAVKAKWGEALIDANIAACLPEAQTTSAKAVKLKGYDTPLNAFYLKPTAAAADVSLLPTNGFRGREAEMEALTRHLDPLFRNEFAGVACVAGPAGIGKSALAIEMRRRDECDLQSQNQWLHLPCDEVFRKSFLPFVRCLKGFFSQEDSADSTANGQHFEARMEELIRDIENLELRESLSAGRQLLAAFIDLPSNDESVAQLEAQARYENTLLAAGTLFSALASMRPLVLVIEDFQWIDPDSVVLLESICRKCRHLPLAIIAACRAQEPAAVPRINTGANEDAARLIWLQDMTNEEAEAMLRVRLRQIGEPESRLSAATLAFILERSAGNPFYMEQLLFYMHEHQLLDSSSPTRDSRALLGVPMGINMLLTARLDRMPRELRDLVKCAAVLGVEFSSDVLSCMNGLGGVDPHLESGATEGLWRALSRLRYLFTHALVRDAAYHVQLAERLRQLHLAAAESYEKLYAADLQPFLPELAGHFERAGRKESAMRYLRMAGEHALGRFQNAAAADFFRRWIKLANDLQIATTAIDPDFHRIDALNGLGQALKQAGEWVEAQANFDLALTEAREIGDDRRKLDALVRRGDILRFRGDYAEAMENRQEALLLAEALDDTDTKATIYGNIGNIHLCQNRSDQALEFYQMQETLARSTNNLRELSKAIGNSGIVYSRRGDSVMALNCYRQQYDLCLQLHDLPGMAGAVGNIGLVLSRRGLYDEAEAKFNEQLALSRRSGDKQGISNAIGNLGVVTMKRGDFAGAANRFREQMAIAEAVGDRRTTAYAAGILNSLTQKAGDALLAEHAPFPRPPIRHGQA